MSDDLLTIMWNKIAALTGGSAEWPIGLGLRPWYLKVAIEPCSCFRGCHKALLCLADVRKAAQDAPASLVLSLLSDGSLCHSLRLDTGEHHMVGRTVKVYSMQARLPHGRNIQAGCDHGGRAMSCWCRAGL